VAVAFTFRPKSFEIRQEIMPRTCLSQGFVPDGKGGFELKPDEPTIAELKPPEGFRTEGDKRSS
jgi:hypothetical protein